MTSKRIDFSEEHAILFIRELKNDFRHLSTSQIVTLVRILLSKLRRYFTVQHFEQIISKTSPLFQFMFAENWPQEDTGKERLELNELVRELVEEDTRICRGLFKSESETLCMVTLALKRINTFFKREGIALTASVITNELQQS
ncbi:MAG: hypothetical protein ABI663_05320 [Chryseolinea sp.]